MAGNPPLGSNNLRSLDFTIPSGSTNSVALTDAAGTPIPLVFSSATPFNVGAQLRIEGSDSALMYGTAGLTLTFKYFAENLETGAASLLAQSTPPHVAITEGTLDTINTPNTITFPSSVTKVSLAANALPAGLYKITGIVLFPAVWGMNAYVEGPIIETF